VPCLVQFSPTPSPRLAWPRLASPYHPPPVQGYRVCHPPPRGTMSAVSAIHLLRTPCLPCLSPMSTASPRPDRTGPVCPTLFASFLPLPRLALPCRVLPCLVGLCGLVWPCLVGLCGRVSPCLFPGGFRPLDGKSCFCFVFFFLFFFLSCRSVGRAVSTRSRLVWSCLGLVLLPQLHSLPLPFSLDTYLRPPVPCPAAWV